MSEFGYALTGLVHGGVGAGVLALLALAVWLERRGEDESFGSALTFASLLQVLQLVLGVAQHVGYQQHLRVAVFSRMPALGWWAAAQGASGHRGRVPALVCSRLVVGGTQVLRVALGARVSHVQPRCRPDWRQRSLSSCSRSGRSWQLASNTWSLPARLVCGFDQAPLLGLT